MENLNTGETLERFIHKIDFRSNTHESKNAFQQIFPP